MILIQGVDGGKMAPTEEFSQSCEFFYWSRNEDPEFDWKSVPVLHDVIEEKFEKRVNKLKLDLELEKYKNERLQKDMKEAKRLHEEEMSQLKATKVAQKKAYIQKMTKKYKDTYGLFKNQRLKAGNEVKHSSRLRKKIDLLGSDKYQARVKKQGIKDFVFSKFKGKGQRQALLTGKKRAVCDKTDICESLVLRALGRACYKHLKKNGPLFYPDISTQDKHNGRGIIKTAPRSLAAKSIGL